MTYPFTEAGEYDPERTITLTHLEIVAVLVCVETVLRSSPFRVSPALLAGQMKLDAARLLDSGGP